MNPATVTIPPSTRLVGRGAFTLAAGNALLFKGINRGDRRIAVIVTNNGTDAHKALRFEPIYITDTQGNKAVPVYLFESKIIETDSDFGILADSTNALDSVFIVAEIFPRNIAPRE